MKNKNSNLQPSKFKPGKKQTSNIGTAKPPKFMDSKAPKSRPVKSGVRGR